MKTKMQSSFREEYIRPILCIIFPEFADIINEFEVSYGAQYSWVTLKGYRRAKYDGPDNRTNKERKRNKPTYVPDTRELIEESYSLDVGIDNHNQYKIHGMVSKEYMAKNFDCVGFRAWTFHGSYGEKKELTDQQQKDIAEYLNSVGIVKPTLEEFFNYYYSDY